MACRKCHQALDGKGDGNIDEITSQQVCHAGADTGCQECGYRVQKHAAENHDGVAGMDVTACTGVGMRMDMVATQARAANRADNTSF